MTDYPELERAKKATESFIAQLERISLRDWFAGQALMGIISTDNGSEIEEGENPFKNVAGIAYKFADAMLAERSKEK